MDPQDTSSRFHTTSWTLIVRARSEPSSLEELLNRYWSPVYAYLRRSGRPREDAADLTNVFLGEIIARRHLLERADPERGRFRSYLLSSLKNSVIDADRKEWGRDGQRANMFVPHDDQQLDTVELSETDDPVQAYDRQFYTIVLNETLTRVAAACTQDGMQRQWRAFEARVVQPTLHGCDPLPMPGLVEELQASSTQEVYDMLLTVKRRLRRELPIVMAELVDDSADIDDEIAALRAVLSI